MLRGLDVQTAEFRREVVCIYLNCFSSVKSKNSSSVFEPIKNTSEDSFIFIGYSSLSEGKVISELANKFKFALFIDILSKAFFFVVFELALVKIVLGFQFSSSL